MSIVMRLGFVVLSLAAISRAVESQSAAPTAALDSALVGVKSVDAVAIVVGTSRTDDKVGNTTESRMESAIQARFTLELRKIGVVVSEQAPNVLVCEVLLSEASKPLEGLIVYRYDVVFNEVASNSRRRNMLVHVWKQGAAGVVGASNTQSLAETIGQSCAESFGNKWLADNPKR